MSNLIFHHYDLSPFSEKIRRLFAFKGLAWRGVQQPLMAPKPDLTPLTGGYRRIPVLQIGADIYCDTALIARVLERLYPTPVTIPAGAVGPVALLEDWADHRLFMQVVPPVVVELLPVLPPEFLSDRSAMTPGFSRATLEATAPHAATQALQSFDRLDAQLRVSKFLLGEQSSLADAACYHCVWFARNSVALRSEVEARPGLAAWFARIEAFTGDSLQALPAADALAIAKASEPRDIGGGCIADPRLSSGQRIEIRADDYGQEVTVGTLVQLGADAVTVLREDPLVGEVAVHYPRAGYHLAPV